MIDNVIPLKDVPFLVANSRGAMYANKTKKYLLPILKYYGEKFTLYINNAYKVACGIGDTTTENVGLDYEKNLFIVFNSQIAPEYFIKFLNWVREQPYYTDDYVYGNILKSPFHMVVLQIPEKFYPSLENFKKGKYSRMYLKEEIDELFILHPQLQGIFTKDPYLKAKFIEQVNKDYGTNLHDFEEDFEVDYPINLQEEKF